MFWYMLKFKEVVQKGACKFILRNTFVAEESAAHPLQSGGGGWVLVGRAVPLVLGVRAQKC